MADDATPTTAPSYDNGFLIPGKQCECDLGVRCANHDDEAEQAYWAARFNAALPAVVVDPTEIALAYESGDPKRFDALESVGA